MISVKDLSSLFCNARLKEIRQRRPAAGSDIVCSAFSWGRRNAVRRLLILFCALVFFFEAALARGEAGMGRVIGRLMIREANPPLDGMVFFFSAVNGPPPSAENYWRVPDKIVRADGEGRFDVVLPEGDYYIRALQRSRGGQIGPPHNEDFISMKSAPEGSPQLYKIKNGQVLDLGTITEAKPFQPRKRNVLSGIGGVVRDAGGNPVEGFFVMAYASPGCTGKPLFVSERSGKDGKYLLGAQEGRAYFLRARDAYGGGPPRGEIITGVYGGETPLSVEVKKDRITEGIDITVIRHQGQVSGR